MELVLIQWYMMIAMVLFDFMRMLLSLVIKQNIMHLEWALCIFSQMQQKL